MPSPPQPPNTHAHIGLRDPNDVTVCPRRCQLGRPSVPRLSSGVRDGAQPRRGRVSSAAAARSAAEAHGDCSGPVRPASPSDRPTTGPAADGRTSCLSRRRQPAVQGALIVPVRRRRRRLRHNAAVLWRAACRRYGPACDLLRSGRGECRRGVPLVAATSVFRRLCSAQTPRPDAASEVWRALAICTAAAASRLSRAVTRRR